MSYYKTCPHCGAHLDPGELCDCIKTAIERMTEEEVGEVLQLVRQKMKEAPASATNTDRGGVDKALTGPDSTFHDNRK